MASQVRKSGRSRVPTKKYTVDAFEGLDLLDSSGDSEPQDLVPPDDSDADEDFNAEVVVTGSSEDDGADESLDGAASDVSRVITPEERSEVALSDADETQLQDFPQAPKALEGLAVSSNVWKWSRPQADDAYHSRGLTPTNKSLRRAHAVVNLYGAESRESLLKSRDKWVDEPTYPSRNADKHGMGGMAYPLASGLDAIEGKGSTTRTWWRDPCGYRALSQQQKVQYLDQGSVSRYYPCSSSQCHYLMGSYGQQKLFHIDSGEALKLDEAWVVDSNDTEAGPSAQNPIKPGWMLNLGSKAQSMDWAPNNDGMTQYLAVSLQIHPPVTHKKESAFVPAEPYAACIQIWAFVALPPGDGSFPTVNCDIKPALVQIVCTEWGMAREIKWCTPPSDCRMEATQDSYHVGLLAAVWTDGFVRVLSIDIDQPYRALRVHVRYQKATFEARPPSTICTCLAWISSTDLAAECANGYVAVWNLPSHTVKPLDNRSSSWGDGLDDVEPYFYNCLSSTYILKICSATPLFPQFLVVSAASGFHHLIDMRSPEFESVAHNRNRQGSMLLAFHSHLQNFLCPDDAHLLQALPIRRFYQSTKIAMMSGVITSLATSLFHSAVLIGCADGSVSCNNPVSRTLDGRARQHWMQKWFVHEFKPSTDDAGVLLVTENSVDQREGMVRITESYKPESINDQTSVANKTAKKHEAYRTITIHEAESAVSALAWNTNLSFGGWAAAGMGSGLLRVEDIAI